MPTFLSVAPLIPTGGSIEQAVEFYTRQMGFEVLWRSGSGAGVRRGAVEFLLVENATRGWIENASFSVGVDDLDGLYAEYRGIAANVGPPEVKGWGRREFHMIVPSGVCLQFYQRG